jgi:hypothetical protein
MASQRPPDWGMTPVDGTRAQPARLGVSPGAPPSLAPGQSPGPDRPAVTPVWRPRGSADLAVRASAAIASAARLDVHEGATSGLGPHRRRAAGAAEAEAETARPAVVIGAAMAARLH